MSVAVQKKSKGMRRRESRLAWALDLAYSPDRLWLGDIPGYFQHLGEFPRCGFAQPKRCFSCALYWV